MKILIIDTAWYGGGAESIARESYKYFMSHGHECYYAYSRGTPPKEVNGIKIGSGIDTYMHILKARIFDADGFASKRATRKFIEHIERIKPDIINIHSIVGYVVDIEILFEYLRNVECKVVWTQHDCWLFTGHCIFFDDVQCNKWKTGCGKCPGKKEYPKSLLLDNSKRNYIRKKTAISGIKNLTLVTPSEWLAGIIKKTYLQQYNIYVINNGIDTGLFKPKDSKIREEYNIQNKKIILGVASRWTMRKGLNYFIELSKLIDDKYQIVLIGVGKEEKDILPRSIIAIQRTNTVEELIQWYTVADAFVNPSIADNFPTVNLEALACGTPVVTFDTGGSWESVGEEYGVLVKEKSSEALYKGIEECMEKGIESSECVKHAQGYDREKRYEEYMALYEKLLRNEAIVMRNCYD